MSRALAIATATLTILRPYVSAQLEQVSPPGQCLPEYSWLFNSLGKSPCDILMELKPVCFTNDELSNLPGPYTAGLGEPGASESPDIGSPAYVGAYPCLLCSTVLYSLNCACLYCQKKSYNDWSDDSMGCSQVYTNVPYTIPSSIEIPRYAYMDVVTGNTFNVTAASMSADGPKSTPVPQSTISTGPLSVSTPTSFASVTVPTTLACTPISVSSVPTAVSCTPTSVSSVPTAVACTPTSVASVPTAVASTFTSVSSIPTAVASTSTSVSSVPTAVSSTPTTASTPTAVASNPTASSTSTSIAATSKKLDVGLIVGGVFGGVIITVAGLIGAFAILRYHRRSLET